MAKEKFTLKRYILRNWRQYVFLAMLLLVWEIAQIIAGIFNGNALTALTQHSLMGFITNEAITAACWGVFLILYFLTGKYGAIVLKNVDNDIRGTLAQAIANQEYEEFNSNTEADYVSWFTNDINQINSNGYQSVTNAFNSMVLALCSSMVLLFYNPSLLLTTICFAVIMILFPKIFNKKLASLSANQSKQNQILTAKLTDIFEGFTNLLMLGRRKLIENTARSASENAGQSNVSYTTESVLSGALINLVSVCAQITLTVESGYLAFKQQIPFGAILIVGSMSGNVFGGLTNISFQLTSIRAVKPIFDKYNNLIKNAEGTNVQVPRLENGISFENLSFSYDEKSKPIFTNFSGTIKKGERVAIVGPSGCGKSTFVKLLAGLLTGYHGKLTWDGIDYATIDKNSLRQQLAYVDQTAYIFDGSLRFNITLGRNVTKEALQKAIRQAGLEDFIAASPQGLDTMLKHAGNNISGGQKQRIALARNLLTESTVILADEITSAIDEKDGQKIEQGLLDLQGVTLVYISHHLRLEIERQFDRIITF